MLSISHPVTPNVSGTHNPEDIVGWTWSDKTPKGATYTWNVTEYSDHGQSLTEYGGNSLNIVEGSRISVTITGNLQEINYMEVLDSTELDLPFEIKIDGKLLENSRNLATEFIFPNIVTWKNGTLTNLFLMNTPEYNHQLQFSPYGYLEGNQYVINITNSADQKVIVRDIRTGLLMWWYLEILNTIISYEFLGMDIRQDDDDISLEHQYLFPLMLGSLFILIVLYSALWKFKNRNHTHEDTLGG